MNAFMCMGDWVDSVGVPACFIGFSFGARGWGIFHSLESQVPGSKQNGQLLGSFVLPCVWFRNWSSLYVGSMGLFLMLTMRTFNSNSWSRMVFLVRNSSWYQLLLGENTFFERREWLKIVRHETKIWSILSWLRICTTEL